MSDMHIDQGIKDDIRMSFAISDDDRVSMDDAHITENILENYELHYGKENIELDIKTDNLLIFTVHGYSEIAVREHTKEIWDKSMYSKNSCYLVENLSAAPVSYEGDEDEYDYDEDYDEDEYDPDDPEAFEDDKKGIGEVITRLDNLIGADEFVKFCKDLISVSYSDKAAYLKEYFKDAVFCFSIGGGNGFSTYLDILADVLRNTGIKDIYYSESNEIKKSLPDKSAISEIIDLSSSQEILSLDLTFRMEKAETGEFKEFIRTVYSKMDRSDLLVFKIPYVEGEAKEKMKHVLSANMPLIFIDIPPFTSHEYFRYCKSYAKELTYDIEEKAADELEVLIAYEQNRDHFYGFRSIQRMMEHIIYEKLLGEIQRREDMPLVITEEDLKPLVEARKTAEGGLEELDEMIGIDEIKERIDEIIVQLELAKTVPTSERPAMHMIFTGNPGTGKTTVARILGRVLKQRGVLSKGLFFEHTGRDLVGRYIGETAPITNTICRDAYGSILFVDEAYTLFRSEEDGKDFGREALDTLITQMENHRQDFIVIMSGYSAEMEKMLGANPGLKSRIPYEIKFRNFTREELAKIFMSMAKKKYAISDDLEKTSKKYFMSLSEEAINDDAFANARYVRNLYERTVSKAALRLQAETGERIKDGSKLVLTSQDFLRASEAEEFNKLQEKKHSFGFV